MKQSLVLLLLLAGWGTVAQRKAIAPDFFSLNLKGAVKTLTEYTVADSDTLKNAYDFDPGKKLMRIASYNGTTKMAEMTITYDANAAPLQFINQFFSADKLYSESVSTFRKVKGRTKLHFLVDRKMHNSSESFLDHEYEWNNEGQLLHETDYQSENCRHYLYDSKGFRIQSLNYPLQYLPYNGRIDVLTFKNDTAGNPLEELHQYGSIPERFYTQKMEGSLSCRF